MIMGLKAGGSEVGEGFSCLYWFLFQTKASCLILWGCLTGCETTQGIKDEQEADINKSLALSAYLSVSNKQSSRFKEILKVGGSHSHNSPAVQPALQHMQNEDREMEKTTAAAAVPFEKS